MNEKPNPRPQEEQAATSNRKINKGRLLTSILLLSAAVLGLVYAGYPSVPHTLTDVSTSISTTRWLTWSDLLIFVPTGETTTFYSCAYDCRYYEVTTSRIVPSWEAVPVERAYELTTRLYSTSTELIPPYASVGLSVENFRIVALLSLVLVGAAIALMLTRQKKVPGRPVRETVQLPVKPPPEEIPIETPVAQPVGLTKFCRECGAKIPKDSVFCEECGMNLAEAEKKVESRARSSSVRTRRGRIKWKLTSEILVIFGITNILWPLTAGRSYFEAIKAVGGNQNFLLIELVLGLLFIVPAIIYDLRRK